MNRHENAFTVLAKNKGIRFLLVLFLVAAVIIEGYYIFMLQDRIEKRNDELKNISVQLQLLKNEGADLKSKLSSTNKTAGAVVDGNSPER